MDIFPAVSSEHLCNRSQPYKTSVTFFPNPWTDSVKRKDARSKKARRNRCLNNRSINKSFLKENYAVQQRQKFVFRKRTRCSEIGTQNLWTENLKWRYRAWISLTFALLNAETHAKKAPFWSVADQFLISTWSRYQTLISYWSGLIRAFFLPGNPSK